jgi:hypothetical protein
MIYQIKKVVHYDSYNKWYDNIITISPTPDFTTELYLKKITKLIHIEKLSPFKGHHKDNHKDICHYAFINNCHELSTIDDIPTIFSLLIANGFKIETDITKMLQDSSVKIKDLICIISN